jgi:ribokinase
MVVVFGSINVDLVARVARIPAPGETVAGASFVTAPGGKGANQALAARQAGAVVHMLGAVGADAFAPQALANLRAAGVDLGGIATVAAPTGVALIAVDDAGENAIVVVPGANAHTQAAQVVDAMLSPATTVLVQLETPRAEVTALAARARRAGARTVLNAAPASALPDTLLGDLDVLLVNEHEAAIVADAAGISGEPAAFVAAMAARGTAAVVTLGARGAIAHVNGALLHLPAPPVDVVDTTGAGDAFAGSFAAALDSGRGMVAAIAAGLEAGSAACTWRGAQRPDPHGATE